MPLPERIEGDLPKRVRVYAPGKYYGMEGKVTLIYYDRLHTGSSYDLLEVKLDNGDSISGAANLFEEIDL
jgi:hypothetical protein